MSGRPLAAQTFEAIQSSVNAALRDEPGIGQLIGEARDLIADPERALLLLDQACDLLATRTGLALADCWHIVLFAASIEFPLGDDGSPLPAGGILRLGHVPGVDGRPVWVLENEQDAAAMAGTVEPGQVWIRADLVNAEQWPKIRAIAAQAVENQLGKVRRSGRRSGSRNVARGELIEQIGMHPDWTDEQIENYAVDHDVWEAALGDYDMSRRRVGRARSDARSKNS